MIRRRVRMIMAGVVAAGCGGDGAETEPAERSSANATSIEATATASAAPTTRPAPTTVATSAPRTSTAPSTAVPAPTTAPPTDAASSAPPTTLPGDTELAPELTTFPVGVVATYTDGSSVVVHAYEQPATGGSSLLPPPSGREFGAADVEVCAGGRPSTEVLESSWSAYGPVGGRFVEDLRAVKIPAYLFGPVAPQTCRRGWVGFLVPVGQRTGYLVWQQDGWEPVRFSIP